ncbi:MAG: hypothetical protein V2A56_07980 [bacterium]
MKRLLLIIGILLLVASTASAQDSGLGLGVMIGNPDGLVAKYWITDTIALDAGLGAYVGGTSTDANGNKKNEGTIVRFHGDILFHNLNWIESTEEFPVFYGAGVYLSSGGGIDKIFGIRAVLGLAYIVQQAPLDLFFELSPVMQLNPTTGIGMGASMGARYYF